MDVTVSDPDGVVVKSVSTDGRLYLGEEYQGREVRAVVEFVEPAAESFEESEKNHAEATESEE